MARSGRPREFDRDAALEAAMLTFWRQGYTSTSMHDLCDAMHIGAPSLYAAFGNKEGLYIEALDRYMKTHGPLIWGPLMAAPTAETGLRRLFQAAAIHLPEHGGDPAGCMATIAVADDFPPVVVERLRAFRRQCFDMLRSRISEATANGQLVASTNVDDLSRFYLSIYQGMSIQARDGAKAAELETLGTLAMAAWPASGSNAAVSTPS